jgi:hypothetical protein
VPVVAVEEPSLLLPVQRVIRRIQIQDDPRRRRLVGIEKVVHEQRPGRIAVIDDLVVAPRGRRGGALQAIERAAARQRVPSVPISRTLRPRQIPLPRRQREQRIVTQRVVIVEILIAERLSQHSLRDQLLHRVLDAIRPTVVREALRKAPQQARPLRHLPEQQQPCIAGLPSAVEGRLYPTASKALKCELIPTTVCMHRADPPVHDLSLNNKPLAGMVSRCASLS